MRGNLYRNYIKRILDIILATSALVVLSPVMLISALLVKIRLGSPIIFCQKRPGKDEQIFEMYKFRSMTDARDENGEFFTDELRLTSFGKKLRATSLDELPELFNILKGDMSIVGPRPQLVKDMVFMTPEQRKRHTITPGLTGLAQINGRNNISWEEKIQWDLKYVNEMDFWLDLFIIIKTINKVVCKSDISKDGMETSEDLGEYLVRTGKITLSEKIQTLVSLNNSRED